MSAEEVPLKLNGKDTDSVMEYIYVGGLIKFGKEYQQAELTRRTLGPLSDAKIIP